MSRRRPPSTPATVGAPSEHSSTARATCFDARRVARDWRPRPTCSSTSRSIILGRARRRATIEPDRLAQRLHGRGAGVRLRRGPQPPSARSPRVRPPDGSSTTRQRVNRALFGADVRSRAAAVALVLLGAAIALEPARSAAATAGASAVAAIGFLLGVPLFYGAARRPDVLAGGAVHAVAGLGDRRIGQRALDRGLSGRFARRTLPAVLGIPVVAGALPRRRARRLVAVQRRRVGDDAGRGRGPGDVVAMASRGSPRTTGG